MTVETGDSYETNEAPLTTNGGLNCGPPGHSGCKDSPRQFRRHLLIQLLISLYPFHNRVSNDTNLSVD